MGKNNMSPDPVGGDIMTNVMWNVIVLPDIHDTQFFHLALTFPVVTGGISKWLKTGAAISN